MGLDSVELLMDVEERFGIRIPDEEAAQMRTVAELYACILRRRVRLDSPVSEILGDTTPWQTWRSMQKELDFRLPQLCAPSWLSFAYGTIFVAAAVLGGWLLRASGVLFFILLSIVPLVLLNIATRPLLCLPVGCETMEGLVIANALKLPTENDHEPTVAWDALCDIISNNLGVAKEKIRPETRFVEDLGF